jgi:hypothetical protein
MGVKDIVGKEELKDLGWDQSESSLYLNAENAAVSLLLGITFLLAIYLMGFPEEAIPFPLLNDLMVVILLAGLILLINLVAVHAYAERHLHPVTKRSITRTYDLDLDSLTKGMVDLLRRDGCSILTLTEDKIIQGPYHPWKYLPDEIIKIEDTDVHILLIKDKWHEGDPRTGAIIGPIGQDNYDVVLRLVRSFQALG